MNKHLQNLTLLVVSLLIGFAICEFLSRLLFKDETVLAPRYHTMGEYGEVSLRRNRSNMQFTHTTPDGTWSFTTNDQGFRNYRDFEYAKPPGTIRVVAVGDSHTQGHECHQDYTYAANIERSLIAKGYKAEVINAGVSGFSTTEALLLLEHELLKYQPDYVVLGFYGNDYEDNLKAGMLELDESGTLIQVKSEHIPGVKIQDVIYAIPGIQWLGENSYFYSVLFNATWRFYKNQLEASAREAIPTESTIATKSRYSDHEIQLASTLVKRMRKSVNAAGAKLILLEIPRKVDEHQFTESIVQEMRQEIDSLADFFVSSELLETYQGTALMHVPSGGQHITEFTHTILGNHAATLIDQDLAD